MAVRAPSTVSTPPLHIPSVPRETFHFGPALKRGWTSSSRLKNKHDNNQAKYDWQIAFQTTLHFFKKILK